MSIQQELLPQLVGICARIDPKCSVVLIGSVARSMERADSDLDLNIILPGDEVPLARHPYIADDNRWQLQVKDTIQSVRIDVAWETEQALRDRLSGGGIAECWPFSQGRVLHDPLQIAEPLVELARNWFAIRPAIAAKLEAEYAAAKADQSSRFGR
jgi:hypothetical protein